MLRVVMLVTDLQPGGTPLRVVRWARWLRGAGVVPTVGCLAGRGPLHEVLEHAGIETFSGGARRTADFLRAATRLRRTIRVLDPDIVHAFLFHANVAARFFGRAGRRRPIITSTATIEIERRWHRRVERLTRRRSDAHVVNTQAVADHVIRDLHFPPDRVVIIPNGLDFETLDATPALRRADVGLPEDAVVIAWAGRFDPVKALDDWIEVFERVRQQLPICGLLIGDGPTRPLIEKILATRGLLHPHASQMQHPGTIRLTGWQPQPAAWLKSANVFLFTSQTEGNSNVILEAMAAGCPVVATAVGGCRDLITGGQTGWLCAAGDIGALADACVRVCRELSLAQKVALQARQAVEKTQYPQAVATQLADLYRRVTLQRC